eukprot:TRINITY_DN75890_c0_g1_i1.p1 TRINITY_DN75890_c0_g1~~TRINITY_DN75890_c0_g1_i1.p1  ORF type:complete len:223 (-),score=8.24 TRINITY_DN75890_c0_g1_i1:57-725(-)
MRFIAMMCVLTVGTYVLAADTVPSIGFSEEIKDVDCIVDSYNYILLQLYLSEGKIDPMFKINMKHIKEYEWRVLIGGYVNPCLRCDPSRQVSEIASTIKSTRVHLLPIVVMGKDWSNNRAANIAFLRKFIGELFKAVLRPIILTNEAEWSRIIGKDFQEFSSYPLWYVSHDKNPGKDDFKPFAGWNIPLGKEYDEGVICDLHVTKNSIFGQHETQLLKLWGF